MIVAANLKTNLTRKETKEYIEKLSFKTEKFLSSTEVMVFPATSSLDSFSTQVIIGAQNSYPTKDGAFTGEIGLVHLQEFAIKTILIGHSERRHILGETQEQIAKKFKFFQELGFKIVYCVGETKNERELGVDATLAYIKEQYNGIDTSYENLIIAYEPVWAIGTGLVPTLEDIENIHTELKQLSSAPLLYGGSVKLNNVKDIYNVPNVDGVLVGSAALRVEDFSAMVEIANSISK